MIFNVSHAVIREADDPPHVRSPNSNDSDDGIHFLLQSVDVRYPSSRSYQPSLNKIVCREEISSNSSSSITCTLKPQTNSSIIKTLIQ